MTVINRRALLLIGAAAGAIPLARQNASGDTLVLSAADDSQGSHWLLASTLTGQIRTRIAVPERAHQALPLHGTSQAIFFGRRPSRLFYVVDLVSSELIQTVLAPEHRHFYGHGAVSRDGKKLFVTENDYINNRGIIGVYENSASWFRVGEMPSGGIAPHQLAFLHNSGTLVVANGGTQTHPSQPGITLNLDTMDPNLCYFSALTGQLKDQVEPLHHQTSLRHLCVAPDNSVIVAAQNRDTAGSVTSPLVLRHTQGQPLQAMQCPAERWQAMNGYIASVASSTDGRWALTTTPRGHSIDLWDLADNTHVYSVPIRDVAGVLWSQTLNAFIVSNGHGQWIRVTTESKRPQIALLSAHTDIRWDNHLNSAEAAV